MHHFRKVTPWAFLLGWSDVKIINLHFLLEEVNFQDHILHELNSDNF